MNARMRRTKKANVSYTVSGHQRVEQELDNLHDNLVVPDWMFRYVHTFASKIVESDLRLGYASLQPSAMYAICVLISEWIMHVTGTTIPDIDQVINAWSAVSRHYDNLLLKKKNILAMNVSSMVATLPRTNNLTETKQQEAKSVLEEIRLLRQQQRLLNIEKEYEEPEEETQEVTAKDLLSKKSYEVFASRVDEVLHKEPLPDRDMNFYGWLEWTKNRWNYKRQLKKLMMKDKQNERILKNKQKEIEQKKAMKVQARANKIQEKREQRRQIQQKETRDKKAEFYQKAKAQLLRKNQKRKEERESEWALNAYQNKRSKLVSLLAKRRLSSTSPSSSPSSSPQKKKRKLFHQHSNF